MAKIDLEKVLIALLDSPFNKQFDDKVKDALKEQGLEYKDGEIVEIQKSKFKVGDWVVLKDGGYFSTGSKTVRIKDIIDREIWFETGTWASEDEVRHWTIEDAKPGDVLCDCHEAYDNPLIFILKKFEHVDFGLVRPSDYSSYCYLTAGDIQRFKEGTYHHEHNIKPATNAQRDTLFTKMKEAGYEWDADKKELKKVDRTKDLSNYIKFLKSFHCWSKEQREIMDKYLEEQIKKDYSSKEDEKVDNERKPLYGRGDIIEYRGCPYFIEEVVTPKENIFYYNAVSLCFGEKLRRISIGAEGEKDIILISNNRFDYEHANIQQKDFAPKATTANRQLYNRAILKLLSDYVEKYPDTRFGQMLYNLGISPVFNEESKEAYWNLCKTINKQNHE